jgi:hypothetical protein
MDFLSLVISYQIDDADLNDVVVLPFLHYTTLKRVLVVRAKNTGV